MITALFDDHHEALVCWREAGLTNLVCLHVDAHLDVMETGFSQESLAGIAAAQSRQELERYRCTANLPGGGLHCGNYLLPALVDGTVTELIWLVPPHLFQGDSLLDSVRGELGNWLDLTFTEYRSLKVVEGRVEGIIKGRPFTVCTAETLPRLSVEQKARLALDIDVDYFVRLSDDVVWQTPQQLGVWLSELEPKVLTIATSCEGGYTPLEHRYLGAVCLHLFGGLGDGWSGLVQAIVQGDLEANEECRRTLWGRLLDNDLPEAIRLSLLYRLGRREEAVQGDSGYQHEPLNLVARRLEQRRYQDGLDLLSELQALDPIGVYLGAYLNSRLSRHEEAVEGWQRLLHGHQLGEAERSLVLRMLAESQLHLGQQVQALQTLKQADLLEPNRADILFSRAKVEKARGARQKAIRSMRKALRSAEGRLSSLPMLLEAARLYEELGQSALGRATRRALKDNDVTGRYTITSLLETSPR